jgi:hypothetical protein
MVAGSMIASPPSETDAEDHPDPVYVYKPALIGPAWELKLKPDGMRWEAGRHTGFVRFDGIRRVRLSFRPVTLQSRRFVTEVWPADGPKIQIASSSWRSLVDQERQDTAYVAFITELHRRLAAIGSTARFSSGMPVVLYGVGLVVLIAAVAAFIGLTVRTLQAGETMGAAVVGAFFLVFAWQVGTYVLRNRPGSYRPENLPANVLPSG